MRRHILHRVRAITSWIETAYLFSRPKNARRLMKALDDATHRRGQEHDLIED